MSVWSKESEQAVIGALLLCEEAWDAIQDSGIKPDDFYESRHKLIYGAIADLASKGKPVDVVTVSEALEESLKLHDAGGPTYLSRLVEITPSWDNALAYADIVVDRSKKRAYKNLGDSIGFMLDDGATVTELEGVLSKGLSDISGSVSEKTTLTIAQASVLLYDRMERQSENEDHGYTTGLADLDALCRPEANRFMLIAARPSMGKSTLALNFLVANAHKRKVPTLLLTLEMDHEECAAKVNAILTGVNMTFMTDPENFKGDTTVEYGKLAAAANIIKETGMVVDIDAPPSVNKDALKSKIRSWCRKQPSYLETGKALVAIDYVGLLKLAGKNSRTHEIGEISKMLKQLARELRIPIIGLHQLNRGLESRPDKRPINADLRDSGELEEDADQIVFIYRDEVYNEDSPEKGIAELIVRKNRGGKIGSVRVAARLDISRFENLQHNYS